MAYDLNKDLYRNRSGELTNDAMETGFNSVRNRSTGEIHQNKWQRKNKALSGQERLQLVMQDDANKFRANLPGMIGAETEQIKKESQNVLDQGLDNTRKNFSRRGLLYSGLRESGEQNLRGKVANQMASSVRDVNDYYNKTADSKNRAAIEAGLQGQHLAQQRQAELENIRMQSSVARTQAMQQLGSGLGMGYGGYLAGRDDTKTPQGAGSLGAYMLRNPMEP